MKFYEGDEKHLSLSTKIPVLIGLTAEFIKADITLIILFVFVSITSLLMNSWTQNTNYQNSPFIRINTPYPGITRFIEVEIEH